MTHCNPVTLIDQNEHPLWVAAGASDASEVMDRYWHKLEKPGATAGARS